MKMKQNNTGADKSFPFFGKDLPRTGNPFRFTGADKGDLHHRLVLLVRADIFLRLACHALYHGRENGAFRAETERNGGEECRTSESGGFLRVRMSWDILERKVVLELLAI